MNDGATEAALSTQTSEDLPETTLGGPHVAIDLPPSPDGASFTAWQKHLSFACEVELVDPADALAFHASTQMFVLQNVIINMSASSHRCRLRRSGEDVARTAVDHVHITLHLEGGYAGHCGRQPFNPKPGDVSFIDFGRPFVFETSPYRSLCMTVPRSAMPETLRDRPLHGLVPPAGRPATRLLARLLRDVYEALPGMTMPEAVAAASAVLELAAGATHGETAAFDDASLADLDLFGRAQAHIERMLADSALSAATLAADLKVSRGALYGVFVRHGGVQAYIRERRLQHAYEVINANTRPRDTIGSIAFSFGFGSEAHFSRVFKLRFGLTPTELRAVGRLGGVDMMPPKAVGLAPISIQALGR